MTTLRAKDIMLTLISRRNHRDWKSLPASFEMDAVRAAFSDCKPHFSKDEIRQRIRASKATTFEELIEAVDGK